MSIADVRPGLRAYLLGDATIAALVGTRVYPINMPQGVTGDSIVYSRISGQGDHHMQGPSGLNRPRIQFDCWSFSIDNVVSLANALKARIDGFRGAMPWGSSSPQDSVEILGVFYDNEFDGYDADTGLYRATQDYFVWFREF